MSRSVELLAAVTGHPASADAERCALTMRSAGAARPEVANLLARAPAVPFERTATHIVATFLSVAMAAMAVSYAIAAMFHQVDISASGPPRTSSWMPWTASISIAVITLVQAGGAIVTRRRQSRKVVLQSASRFALELIGLKVPATVARDIVAFLFELDGDARTRLSAPARTVSALPDDENQRLSVVLATHTGLEGPALSTMPQTVAAALLLLLSFALFYYAYFVVLSDGMAPLIPGLSSVGVPS